MALYILGTYGWGLTGIVEELVRGKYSPCAAHRVWNIKMAREILETQSPTTHPKVRRQRKSCSSL